MLVERLKDNKKPELKLNKLQKHVRNKIAQKINDGLYRNENIECPICNTSQSELIGKKDRYGLSYKTNICINCGLVYTNPRMDQESYNQFYNEDYRKLYVGNTSPNFNFFNTQRNNGKKIYSYLTEHNLIQKPSSFILEIGCGAGGIVDVFKENGHKIKGIDLGKEYINYGKEKYNLDLEVGTLSDIKLEETPDIIIYSHVLEHILDLNKELQTLRKYVNKDTIIYIEVPRIKEIHKNYEANILKYFQNAHTFNFSLETLSNLFAKSGFELLHGNQFVQSAFRLKNKQVNIKNDYKSVREYILKTENMRWLYPYTLNGIKQNSKALFIKIIKATHLSTFIRKIKSH